VGQSRHADERRPRNEKRPGLVAESLGCVVRGSLVSQCRSDSRALARPRGSRAADPLVAENKRLRTKVDHLQVRLSRAEKVIAVQGNVSALLRELSLESAEPKSER
jgi:hypothetical protein